MLYALSLFFLLLGLISLIMVIASLFTPKTVLFFKTKTRLRGVLIWFIIGLICLVAIGEINEIQVPGAEGVTFHPFGLFQK